MDFKLELAHLQLTLRCNLRCSFCGQWGEHGFLKGRPAALQGELSTEEWLRAIDQIMEMGEGSGRKPGFVVWGGEPLLHEGVERILSYIKSRGCQLAMVSNGTLLERHAKALAESLSALYISLDGPGEAHDKIRNFPGLHDKIERGLAALPKKGGPLKTALCAVVEANFDKLQETALYAGSIGFDKIIFQNLIFLLPEEAARYEAWLKELGVGRCNAASWTCERIPEFSAKLPDAIGSLQSRAAAGGFPLKVEVQPLGLNSSNVLSRMEGRLSLPGSPAHCLAPFHHINIGPDGSVRHCVDYNELDFGSLCKNSLREILLSPLALKFRAAIERGDSPACSRCPWRCKADYGGV